MKDEKLIEYLKNRRLDLGLSLRDVAQIAGVNASTVKRWEDGRIEDMKRDKIEGYAKALHIPPAVIMGWQAPPAGIITELTNYEEQLLMKFRSLDSDDQHMVEKMINRLYAEVSP